MTVLHRCLIASAIAAVVGAAAWTPTRAETPVADAPSKPRVRVVHADAADARMRADAAPFVRVCRERGGGAECDEMRHMQGRPLIGVILEPDAQAGVRIAGVTPKGPAAEAGLRTGDRLLAVAGRALDGADAEARVSQAREALKSIAPNANVALRYERDGRASTAHAVPRAGLPAFSWSDGMGDMAGTGQVVIRRMRTGDVGIEADALESAVSPEAMRVIRRELHRAGANCEGPSCRTPILVEAFRWNGLNLASVDAKLGRYFGAQRGVLVLSPGEVLDGLEAGDVIQRIDAREVDTPREAMETLRAKPADSRVDVTYLRDRASRTTQVTVPRAPELAMLAPPAPPAPPSMKAPPAPPLPPAPRSMKTPPAPPAPHSGEAPPAPPAPPSPPSVRMTVVPAPAIAREMRVRNGRGWLQRVD